MTFHEYLKMLGGSSYLYANASNALKDLLDYLVKRSGMQAPNIVLPSYIPAKLYRTALAAGLHVRFLEIYDACVFDISELGRLIDNNTIAVCHVHLFGIPYKVHEVRELTRKRNVLLIEDCALTIGSQSNGHELGTIGDFATFSMRKMFMYSEGGFLRLSEPFADFRPHYEWRVKNCFSVTKYLKQRAKYAYVRLTGGADPLHIVKPDPVGYMDWSTPKQTLNVKMLSSFTELRLKFANVTEAVEQRRANYRYVSERFPASKNLQPVNPRLPDNATPYSFPFLVHNGERDKLRQALVDAGTMPGAGWPESPYTDGMNRTRALAAQLLEVPIHQALTRQQIDRSLRVLEKHG